MQKGVYHHTVGSNTATRSQLHGAALAYSKKGKPVFPCKPGGKEPLTPRGHLNATTDAARINGFWNAHPGANIGIPTGERSGFLILDIDEGGAASLHELEREHGGLPATYTVETGSGGKHYYFRYPAGENVRNSAGKLGPGLDIRGEGGYIIAPPSRTTGSYTSLERRPLANPPAWLLEKLREPSVRPEKPSGGNTPTLILAAGEKIPEGARNDNLTRIAGRLHDGTRSLDQLTADLLEINASRCAPPLPDREVLSVAGSIHRKPPAKPSKEMEPEVLEILDEVEATHLWGREWTGLGWKTPRSTLASLIKEARKHGRIVEDGIEVTISVRALALVVGGSKASITRAGGALDKLKAEGIIRSAQGSGTQAGSIVLLARRARVTHSPNKGRVPSSGSTLRAPLSAPRLRWSKPIWETVNGQRRYVDTIRRLGKSAEAIVDTVERAGGAMELEALAAELGIKRPRDMRRRVIARLEAAGVVECSPDNTVRLRMDWLSALERRREEDEEIMDHERDRKRYEGERKNYRNELEVQKLRLVGMSPEEISEAVGIGIEDVRAILGVPDRAPTVSEMDERRREPVEADGYVEDLERVEGDQELSDLAVAVRDYLERNPHRANESAGWIANVLWAWDLYPEKPGRVEVAAALEQLGGGRYREEIKRGERVA